MELQLETLQHTNIECKIYDIILSQIISGLLPPGTRISEEDMAGKLGVSRTPVREAIRRLAQDGLVELLPRRGVYIRKFSRKDIEDIYEVRIALESLAVSLATPNISDSDLEMLRSQTELSIKQLAEGNQDTFLDYDALMHSVIITNSGNKRLETVLGSLTNLLMYFKRHGAIREERVAEALEEHNRILAALEQRDPIKAEAAIKEHIESSRDNILKDMNFKE